VERAIIVFYYDKIIGDVTVLHENGAKLADLHYTQDGKNIHTEIEVNKPFSIDGWKIYQLSYNEQMGKWSNLSIFEIVTDPWMPVVYVGIFMLLFGAVGMFLTASRKKEVKL